MAERYQAMCDYFNRKANHAGAVVDEDGDIMEVVPMSTDEETRKSVGEAIESAAQASNSLRIIAESTQKSQEAPVQKYKKFYYIRDKPWQGLYEKHLDFLSTVVPQDQPINYDSCSYADFHDKVKSVIPQDEIDHMQFIECPCGLY
eukprot:8842256-Karenia_brevis.AAC.1